MTSRCIPPNPFVWPGSKARLMPTILPLLPPHHHYISVFGGTGADMLAKPRSRVETFNDLDKAVVGFFQVLADSKTLRALCRRIETTAYSRREYENAFHVLRSENSDPVTQAWAFLVAANQGQAAAAAVSSKARMSNWGYVRRGTSPAARWPRLPTRLEAVAARFKAVQIENRPWEDILRRYDAPDALFFLDPPYLPSTRTCHVYRHEMSEDDHRRLLRAILRLSGRAVITGYASPLYQEFLAGWQAVHVPQKCLIARGKAKPLRDEVIWVSRGPGQRQVSSGALSNPWRSQRLTTNTNLPLFF
jgi:DNA adenine methylase